MGSQHYSDSASPPDCATPVLMGCKRMWTDQHDTHTQFSNKRQRSQIRTQNHCDLTISNKLTKFHFHINAYCANLHINQYVYTK